MNKNTIYGDEIGMIIDQALERLESKKKVVMLNREAVARRLHISMSTLWRWDRSGYLKAVRYGRAIWYRLADIEALERGERNINEGGNGNE